ncbi:MAG: tryptophan--tRNA ligase [Planctomycetota bacterium]
MKHRVLSGIQPSGTIHIGNYHGAIKNWVNLLDEYECYFCIVDYHAMTVAYDAKEMPKRVFDATCVNMACGLDPDRCVLFVQSHVVQHTELAWILNCLTPIGEAMRMTQFKEKSDYHKNNINLGLLTYPILQAADILLYRPKHVPVGEDQVQHIELSRDIARKFNNTFGEYFAEPTALLTQAARIMGLDGKSKMSKSLNNYIAITDDADAVTKKLRSAFTDPARLRKGDPGNPEICNLFSLHKVYSPPEDVFGIDNGCRSGEWGCVDCKKKLAARINDVNEPIIERYNQLLSEPDHVRDVLKQGAERAKVVALETMDQVHKLTGLR